MPRKKKKQARKLARNKNVKMVPGGKTNQISHAGVRYHKGYVYDKLRHTVLTINQMSKVDREFVEGVLTTTLTGPDAMTLPKLERIEQVRGELETGEVEHKNRYFSNGWACSKVDHKGNVYILSYHGIEVALFFKRQLTEIKLEPGDKQPEGVLQDPIDAWQKLNILGQSSKKVNFVLASAMKSLQSENQLLKTRIKTLEEYTGKVETEIYKLTEGKPKKRRKK